MFQSRRRPLLDRRLGALKREKNHEDASARWGRPGNAKIRRPLAAPHASMSSWFSGSANGLLVRLLLLLLLLLLLRGQLGLVVLFRLLLSLGHRSLLSSHTIAYVANPRSSLWRSDRHAPVPCLAPPGPRGARDRL